MYQWPKAWIKLTSGVGDTLSLKLIMTVLHVLLHARRETHFPHLGTVVVFLDLFAPLLGDMGEYDGCVSQHGRHSIVVDTLHNFARQVRGVAPIIGMQLWLTGGTHVLEHLVHPVGHRLLSRRVVELNIIGAVRHQPANNIFPVVSRLRKPGLTARVTRMPLDVFDNAPGADTL